MKWSYAGASAWYEQLFEAGPGTRLITVPVAKRRALRKILLEEGEGRPLEVVGSSPIGRGLGFELTELEISGNVFCSLAFEAFPDDPATADAFVGTVEAFLEGLTDLELTANQSWSYPAWLASAIAA